MASAEYTKAEVLARMTGNREILEKKHFFPGMYYWRRPSKISCQDCGKNIKKGEEEVSIAVDGNRWGAVYNHYHLPCFLKLLKQMLTEQGWEI